MYRTVLRLCYITKNVGVCVCLGVRACVCVCVGVCVSMCVHRCESRHNSIVYYCPRHTTTYASYDETRINPYFNIYGIYKCMLNCEVVCIVHDKLLLI